MSFFIFICKGIENILGENAIYLIFAARKPYRTHYLYEPSFRFCYTYRSLMGEEQFEKLAEAYSMILP